MANVRTCSLTLHGHRVSYRYGGDGPLLVLIHGITSSSASWEPVLPGLAEHFTILAPDLLGHGQSDKPAGDYSLGSHACLVRDLMLALGHERGTIVGHSLGGGVAMQVALPVPGAGRPARARGQRRPGARGQPLPARRHAAGLGARAAADRLARGAGRRRGRLAGARAHRAAGRLGPGGDRPRHRVAERARRPPRVRAHGPLGDRRGRPARRRARPALPRRGRPFAARVGRDRPDHPRPPRPPRARADARQPAGGLRRGGPLPAPRRPAALRPAAARVRRRHGARERGAASGRAS